MSKEEIVLIDKMIVTCEMFEGTGEIMETVENPDGSFQHRIRHDMTDGWVPADKLKFHSNPVTEAEKAEAAANEIRDAGVNGRIVELEARIVELEAELEIATAPAKPAVKKSTPAPAPGK